MFAIARGARSVLRLQRLASTGFVDNNFSTWFIHVHNIARTCLWVFCRKKFSSKPNPSFGSLLAMGGAVGFGAVAAANYFTSGTFGCLHTGEHTPTIYSVSTDPTCCFFSNADFMNRTKQAYRTCCHCHYSRLIHRCKCQFLSPKTIHAKNRPDFVCHVVFVPHLSTFAQFTSWPRV